jgi:hypothetical protein
VQRKTTLITSVALWLAAVGAAQASDDITMQGLDDVADVARVLSAVELELRAPDAGAKQAPRNHSAAATLLAESPPEPPAEHDRLVAALDREEESEGEIEDFDVPEDITVPEPTEDEE